MQRSATKKFKAFSLIIIAWLGVCTNKFTLIKCETFRFLFRMMKTTTTTTMSTRHAEKRHSFFGLNFLSWFFFLFYQANIAFGYFNTIYFSIHWPMHMKMRRLFLTFIQLLFTCWFSYQILSRFFFWCDFFTHCLLNFIVFHSHSYFFFYPGSFSIECI